MPGLTLTDVQLYAALFSSVYNNAPNDQWIDFRELNGLKPALLDDDQSNALKAAGLLPGSGDSAGFWYAANGFGALLLEDGSGNYIIALAALPPRQFRPASS